MSNIGLVAIGVLDEAVDGGLAGKAFAFDTRGHRGEREDVVQRQVDGGLDGLGDRVDDPPIDSGQVGSSIRLVDFTAEVPEYSVWSSLVISRITGGRGLFRPCAIPVFWLSSGATSRPRSAERVTVRSCRTV
ncbi:hypothetical protein ACGFZJ_11930 [Streptomyces sp. NPDC048253]|uniref:hypothetical protein n=1 Tax=Streptomyces sp. NPDC048253 TaxID=3365524 RepID=UPI00371AC6D9